MVPLPPKEKRTSDWMCGRMMTIVNGDTEERRLAYTQLKAHLAEEEQEHQARIAELKRSSPMFRLYWEKRYGNHGS